MPRTTLRVLALLALATAAAPAVAQTARELPAPPVARIVPRTDTLHGDVRVDNYFWLRDRQNPEVVSYLEGGRRAVRGRDQHHGRRLHPPHGGRVGAGGNPSNEAEYRYMLSYSPYDNVERKEYSTMLVTTGLNDPRVAYWKPAKWVARLRAHKTDGNVLLLRTNMGAGHGGSSGRYDALRETALRYAFILHHLGIDR